MFVGQANYYFAFYFINNTMQYKMMNNLNRMKMRAKDIFWIFESLKIA
jgi:hypothetical protein